MENIEEGNDSGYYGSILYEAKDILIKYEGLMINPYPYHYVHNKNKELIPIKLSVPTEFLYNHGNFAVRMIGKDGRKYLLVAMAYGMKRHNAFSTSLSLEALQVCDIENRQLIIYCWENNFFHLMNAQLILNDFNKGILKVEIINGVEKQHRHQWKIQNVAYQKYCMTNLRVLRKHSANEIEKYLANLFHLVSPAIMYVGDNRDIIFVLGINPDYVILGQNKYLFYNGLYYHNKEDLDEIKRKVKEIGAEVYFINSDVYSNQDMGGWKDIVIGQRVSQFYLKENKLTQEEIDTKYPMIKQIIVKAKKYQPQTKLVL